MELICALVFVLLNLANASPYGYGVKGGASAKAEAKAASGAFSGFLNPPINFPSNGGYSASFSNSSSSSSSFASSSSSSSSSSFSISGTGAAGLAGTGVNGISTSNLGGEGCATDRCQQGQSNSIHESNDSLGSGAGLQTSAGAIAQAGTYTGLQNQAPISCGGAECPKQPTTGCDGSSCPNNVETENKCNSGSCGEPTQNLVPNDNDSDDIPFIKVVTDQSKPDALNYNKPYGSNFAGNFNSGHDYLHSNAAGHATGTTYSKPSIHLTTPIESSKPNVDCGTTNCYSPGFNNYPNDEKLPSSYNVPSHTVYGTTPIQDATTSCTSNNCKNDQPNLPFTTSIKIYPIAPNYVKPDFFNAPHKATSGIKCTTSYCPSSPAFTTSNNPSSLSLSPLKTPPHNIPSKDCKSSNCADNSYTNIASSGISIPGTFDNFNKHPGINTSYGKIPPQYTGGFGGPPGLLSPNDKGYISVNIFDGSPNYSPSTHNKILPSISTNSNLIGTTGSTPSIDSHGTTKPNIASSGIYSPVYTGGFGGPPGILSVDSDSKTGSVLSEFNKSKSSSSTTHNKTFSQTSGFNGPSKTTSTTPTSTYGTFVTSKPDNTTPVRPNVPVYSAKPNIASSVIYSPVYTGGFGGPPGILSVDSESTTGSVLSEFDKSKSTSSTTPSKTFTQTIRFDGPTKVTSPIPIARPTSTYGTFVTSKPDHTTSVHPNVPVYTGGFGGPSGILDVDSATVAGPTLDASIPPSFGANYNTPSNINDYTVSSGSTNTNGIPITQTSPASGFFITKKPSLSTPILSNVPGYAGGFGGPSGILNTNGPSESGTINTANTHSIANNGIHDKTYSSGLSDSSGQTNTNAVAASGSSAETGSIIPQHNVPVYTGSFGGPSGILNTNGPSESGTINTANTHSIANHGIHDKTYSSGLSDSAGQTNTNAVAASGSSAETGSIIPQNNIPVYTGGFGGPSGILNTNGASGNGPTSTTDAPNISNFASHVNRPTYTNGFSGPTEVTATIPIAVSTPTYGTFVTSKPNPSTPAYNNEPVYTGGFGGPPGILSVDSFESIKPSTIGAIDTSKSPIIGANDRAPGYNNGNKGFSGSTNPIQSTIQSIPTFGVFVTSKPNLPIPTYSDVPEYTGGFGGPLGMSAFDNGLTSTAATQNIDTHNKIPTYISGVSGSSAQSNTNTIATSESSAATGSFVPHYNHYVPVYTGGFGGPSGILSTDKTLGSGSTGTINTPNTANTITHHKTPNTDEHGVISGTNIPNAISTAGLPTTSPFIVSKPNLIANVQNKESVYTGGFGGPSGLLNPDDYAPPIKPAVAQQRPPVKPAYPYDGSIAPSLSSQNYPISGKPIPCLSGVCGSQEGVSSSSNVASTALASSNAVVYTGGFGGPSGILKPFDDGKINNIGQTDSKDGHGQFNPYYPSPSKIHSYSGSGGATPSIPNISTYYDAPPSEVISSYETGGVPTTIQNNAQANSVAGASAGTYGSGIVGPGEYTRTGPCNQGCGHWDSVDRDHNNYNFGASNAFSSSKSGSWNALGRNTNAAGAEAKSVAGAFSGTDFGRFGLGKSFASSSASAHASSGAGIKGGYGR